MQIFQDTNHNTGGLSGEKSDAPLTADGYETLIFNGGAGDADPDLAWVRINAGAQSQRAVCVQEVLVRRGLHARDILRMRA